MRFSVDRNRFIQDVQHVVKAVSSRTTIPILVGIKIVVTKQGITLTGSDSDISIEAFIPVEEDDEKIITVTEPGSVVLDARLFADVVKKLDGDEIELVVQERFMTTIRSGTAVYDLNGLDPDEYPRLPQLEEEQLFRLPQDLLKTIIRQTVFAVSTQETRPVLTGVNLELNEEGLTCTATDSHRLAMKKVNIEKNTDSLAFSNVVIPGKSLNELSKILDDSNDFIEIVISDNQILFKMNNLLFFSRLLEGQFPVTKNMFPTEYKTSFHLKRTAFLHTLERALLLSREGKNNVINLKTLDSNEIEITSTTPDIGKVTEQIDVTNVDGDEMRISFNGKNVIDSLKVIDSEEVVVQFTGAMSPFTIRPADHDNDLHLFSPVRTY